MTPVLSIVIPTYHRSDEVNDNVRSLLKIPNKDIEIVVVDNDAECDETKNILSDINDERFHYYRNETNIGRVKNIIKAVELAQSDFTLLISTDDRVNIEYISEVIDSLDNKLGILLGNIVTEIGNYDIRTKEGCFEAGYEAYMNLPFLGNLAPMVINKKMLDFEELYAAKDEIYMQNRIALMACQKGKLVTKAGILGYAHDDSTYTREEVGEFLDLSTQNIYSKKTGRIYYHPKSRAEQVCSYSIIMMEAQMKKDELRRVLLLWIERFLHFAMCYTAMNKDSYVLVTHGQFESLGSKKILQTFYTECSAFFASKKDVCSITGALDDLYQDHLQMIMQNRELFMKMQEKGVYLFGASSFGMKVSKQMKIMEITVNGFLDNSKEKQEKGFEGYQVYHPEKVVDKEEIILITSVYRREILEQLKQYGKTENVYVLDENFPIYLYVWAADFAKKEAYSMLRG